MMVMMMLRGDKMEGKCLIKIKLRVSLNINEMKKKIITTQYSTQHILVGSGTPVTMHLMIASSFSLTLSTSGRSTNVIGSKETQKNIGEQSK